MPTDSERISFSAIKLGPVVNAINEVLREAHRLGIEVHIWEGPRDGIVGHAQKVFVDCFMPDGSIPHQINK